MASLSLFQSTLMHGHGLMDASRFAHVHLQMFLGS